MERMDERNVQGRRTVVRFPKEERKSIEYRIITVTTKDVDEGNTQYPALCVVDKETGLLIRPTFLEFYMMPRFVKGNRMATITAGVKVVERLLNYLLENETVNGIHEIDRTILARFETYIKVKEDGTNVSRDTWERYIDHLYDFLRSYHEQNHERLRFRYDPSDFRKARVIRRESGGQMQTVHTKQTFAVPPKQKPKKVRYLPFDYLPMLEEEVRMHAPDLLFAVQLQARTGIREGGVVNISRDRISVPAVGDIVIDICERAPFAKEHKGKTPVGAIKKYRTQKVYPAFNYEVRRMYREHLLREEMKFEKLGKKISPEGPLFTNKYGNPLTVAAYNARMRQLWFDHFVPDLESYAHATGQYDMNRALIDAYKTQWIGCHALRHWFTMYLAVREGLDDVQIKTWRGDKSMTAFHDYMHVNHQLVELYEKVAFRFQSEMLMAIKDGTALRYLEGGSDGNY